ncbi:MAG: hypothetical protein AB2A00_35155 [Myxococcota bacterium]
MTTWMPAVALAALVLSAPASAAEKPRDDGMTVVIKDKEKPGKKPAPSEQAQKKGPALTGGTALLVAGSVGAMVPLLLFVVPCLWFAAFGPYAGAFIAFALVWGALMTGLGGAVVWALLAYLSDVRSGLVFPVLTAATLGVVGTLVSAVMAASVFWPSLWFLVWSDTRGLRWDRWWYWWTHPVTGTAIFISTCLWTAGLVTTSILAPFAAAWVYQQLGAPREDQEFRLDLFTTGNAAEDLKRVQNGGKEGKARGATSSKPREQPEGNGRKSSRPTSRKSTVGPRNKNVGAACSSKAECHGVCAQEERFGGGMCTQKCQSTSGCPDGAACVSGGVCAVSCETDGDCAGYMQGYVCRPVEGISGASIRACVAP